MRWGVSPGHRPTPALCLFAEHIDSCYRLDAWRLGLVHHRLAQMRVATRGGHFGAYGPRARTPRACRYRRPVPRTWHAVGPAARRSSATRATAVTSTRRRSSTRPRGDSAQRVRSLHATPAQPDVMRSTCRRRVARGDRREGIQRGRTRRAAAVISPSAAPRRSQLSAPRSSASCLLRGKFPLGGNSARADAVTLRRTRRPRSHPQARNDRHLLLEACASRTTTYPFGLATFLRSAGRQ
jgi:hypothetical protein